MYKPNKTERSNRVILYKQVKPAMLSNWEQFPFATTNLQQFGEKIYSLLFVTLLQTLLLKL